MPKLAHVAAAAGLATLLATTVSGTGVGEAASTGSTTTSPIQHLVVIFQENVSFDHYFGTYPNVNGLTHDLLTNNPNGVNPRLYDPTNINDVITCDQDHDYTDEETAFDGGQMDQFVSSVGNGSGKSPTGQPCAAGDVMNYYDGKAVTALWNYAGHYAMSDNSYGTTFGPSSPGAINLASGNTGGVDQSHMVNNPSVGANGELIGDGNGGFSVIGDPQPYWDDCSTRDAVAMTGQNVGDLLNAKGLSWGWFEGGFRPTKSFADAATAVGHPDQPTATFTPDEFKNAGFQSQVSHSSNQGICDAVHPVGAGLVAPLATGNGQYGYKDDYIPHHEPFQYYASTANPHHLTLEDAGETLANVGTDTQSYVDGAPQFNTPNHNYDMSDFDHLVAAITRGDLPPSALPAVSFLKAPGYQDGHGAYSDPLDEQEFLVNEINALQKSPDWKSTAVVISYDDSDGWYDDAYSGVTNPSQTSADSLTGDGMCGDSGT